jgi:hypothetical protein
LRSIFSTISSSQMIPESFNHWLLAAESNLYHRALSQRPSHAKYNVGIAFGKRAALE